MKIIEIKDKKEYNYFLKEQKHSSFLQSWQWGELQEKLGQKIYRLGFYDHSQLCAVCLMIKKNLFLKQYYFYCPNGPIISKHSCAQEVFEGLQVFCKKMGGVFTRFEPQSSILPLNLKRIKKTIDLQPAKTIILKLNKTPENLLKAMHQKTRYNIRLAEKKGVEIVLGKAKDLKIFWQILNQTGKRDNFNLHGKKHYEEMLKINGIELFLAKYNNEIIAANIVSFFGDTVVYLHGASADKYRNVMAPYALQWHIIKLAQSRGFKYYDFYGIDEKKWPGVTRFKKGFDGDIVQHSGTYDFIFKSSCYKLYKLLRNIRRKF